MVRLLLRPYAFVRHIAATPFHPVIDAVMAGRAERFVVVGGYAQRGSQLFVKAPQIGELRDANREFPALIRKQKFLIAGIPQPRELPGDHDAWNDRHLVFAGRCAAQLGSAAMFLDAAPPHPSFVPGSSCLKETLTCACSKSLLTYHIVFEHMNSAEVCKDKNGIDSGPRCIKRAMNQLRNAFFPLREAC